MFTYEGKPCAKDPSIGLIKGAVLGPRTTDWWYEGHPCSNYIAGVAGCSAIHEYGDPCGCCTAESKELSHG